MKNYKGLFRFTHNDLVRQCQMIKEAIEKAKI